MTDVPPVGNPDKPKPGYVTAADGHVYHKSATQQADTAPTNEETLKNADKSKGLSNDEAQFVTVVDYHWHLHGLLDPQVLMDEYGYDEDEYNSHCSSASVAKALEDRGIPCPVGTSKLQELPKKHFNLTPLQLVVANTLLDLNDTRSNKKKLQDAGVSTYKYNAWLKQEEFKAYLQARSESLFGDIQFEANLALADRVKSGDLKAIEYYNEMTGRYIRESRKQPQQVQAQQDIQSVIIKIIEIVVDEVKDQDTAFRISDRLRGLVAGVQVASALTNTEPIPMPELAPPRALTPEVEALKAKGLGYDS